MTPIQNNLLIVALLAAVPTTAQVTELLTVGVLEGDPAYVFGEIRDLSVDAAGNIYVLDEQERNVRVFGPDGRYKQTVGGEGSGPGEYQAPQAIFVHPRDTLLVLDPANLRITAYSIDDSLVYIGDRRTPFPAYDLCTLADRLFVVGRFEGRYVHELGTDLELMHSLAEPVAVHPMLRRSEYRYLDCGPDVLLPYGTMWGRLAAFGPDGRLRWELTVTDFQQLAIETLPNAVRYSYPESGWYHTLLGTIRLADTLVVQIGREVRADSVGSDAPPVTWIGVVEGREIWRREVPFRVVVKRGRMLYGISDKPFPRVIVGRL